MGVDLYIYSVSKDCDTPVSASGWLEKELLFRGTTEHAVWVGDGSWFAEAFPHQVDKIERTIPQHGSYGKRCVVACLPVVDEAMIEIVSIACELENRTQYQTGKKEDIVRWLRAHIGRRVMTVTT